MFQDQSSLRIEQLNEENSSLRCRLHDVAHSPLSDNEKQQLLLETHRHSSAPASIATNVSFLQSSFCGQLPYNLFLYFQLLDDGAGGDLTTCPTPEWDKHSSSNVSEVSVACLQDKINQMQETHYRYVWFFIHFFMGLCGFFKLGHSYPCDKIKIYIFCFFL